MLSRLKEKATSKTGNRLLNNFFSLSSVQLASYILPLIAVPYLVRVLGVEKFGLIAFAQAMVQYFVILTDYGFGLSATKQIAENREDKRRLSEIFSAVLVIKILMLLASLIVLTVLVFGFESFAEDWQLYFFTFGIVVGQAMFPAWYFQGIEKMHITAIVDIIPKVIFTLSIFIFVKSPEDYLNVALINSLGYLFAGSISLWLAIFRFNASFKPPGLEQMRYQLKEGWHIFIGIISSTYSLLNVTFFLGIMTSPATVGYYTAVEKIIRPLALLNHPVIYAIFPYLSNLAKANPDEAYNFSRNMSFLVSCVMFAVGLVLFIFADKVIALVFGGQFGDSVMILKIMAFVPMLHSFIHIYAIPNMIIFDFKKVYSQILLFGFILSPLTLYLLIGLYAASGAALTVLLTDLVVLFGMGAYLRLSLNYDKIQNG